MQLVQSMQGTTADSPRALLTQQLQDTLLPRLRYASLQQIGAFAQSLNATQKSALGYATGIEITRLEGLLAGSNAPANAADDLRVLQLLYSEIYHAAPYSTYGLAANPTGAFDVRASFESAITTLQRNGGNLVAESDGTLAQRIAFLADTDYATYRTRELSAINAQYGTAPTDAADVVARDGAIRALPTAADYYLARSALIDAATRSGTQPRLVALEQVAGFMRQEPGMIPRPGAPIVARTIANDPIYAEYMPSTVDVEDPVGLAARQIYDRYLRGGLYTDGATNGIDRYLQFNLGYRYLAGWQLATAAQSDAFADSLDVGARAILLGSLMQIAISARDRGSLSLATAAQQMAVFIDNRYNEHVSQYSANLAFLRLIDVERSRSGYGQSQIAADMQQLPRDMQLLAITIFAARNSAYNRQHPSQIRYTPAWGLEFIDRSILNTAEFLAPVYRTALRVAGASHALVTLNSENLNYINQFSDIEAIRAVLDGNFHAQLGPTGITYGLGEIVLDGANTILIVLPGPGAAAGRLGQLGGHFATVSAAAIASSLTMAAVEMAPIPAEYRTALRLVAGLASGVVAGAMTDAVLTTPLIRATRQLERASSELQAVERQIAQLGQSSVPAALTQRASDLRTAVQAYQATVTALRDLGGTALTAAESSYNSAQQALEQLEVQAAAPGRSASQAAALRPQIQAARAELDGAARQLETTYIRLGRQAEAAGIVPASGRPMIGCFAAGTHLRTPDGSKVIEDIRPGDRVLSANESEPCGEVRPRAVLSVTRRLSKVTAMLVAGRTVRTTSEHPFWVEGRGWTAARLLRPGDMLRSHDGEYVAVERWVDIDAYENVYNMEVERDHTYFVGEMGWGFSVWSHNTNPCGAPVQVGNGFVRIGEGTQTWTIGGRTFNSRAELDAFIRVRRATRTGPAGSFNQTHTIRTRADRARVAALEASMRENGWVGEPIAVAEVNGQLYILDGHHRVAAAGRAGIPVQYRVVGPEELAHDFGVTDLNRIVWWHLETFLEWEH